MKRVKDFRINLYIVSEQNLNNSSRTTDKEEFCSTVAQSLLTLSQSDVRELSKCQNRFLKYNISVFNLLEPELFF